MQPPSPKTMYLVVLIKHELPMMQFFMSQWVSGYAQIIREERDENTINNKVSPVSVLLLTFLFLTHNVIQYLRPLTFHLPINSGHIHFKVRNQRRTMPVLNQIQFYVYFSQSRPIHLVYVITLVSCSCI